MSLLLLAMTDSPLPPGFLGESPIFSGVETIALSTGHAVICPEDALQRVQPDSPQPLIDYYNFIISLYGHGAIIPFRFGTSFENMTAMEKTLSAMEKDILRCFKKIDDCVEDIPVLTG